MPHSLSAAKRVRQNARRRARNRAIKSRLHTAGRRFDEAVDAGDVEAARDRFREVQRLLHRAAANGPLHRNTVARTISRMQRALDRMTGGADAAA